MVAIINGNWLNGTLVESVAGLSGKNTVGTRSLGEGVFYLEIKVIQTRNYANILLSPIQDKEWVVNTSYTDSLCISLPTPLTVGSVIGILLDLSGDTGYLYWNLNGGIFSNKIPILSNSNNNIINSIKVGLVGSASAGGAGTYHLIYDPLLYLAKEDNILDFVQGFDVYSFDGNYKLTRKKLTLKNPTTNQHYSLADKTLIPLPDSSPKNMILHGIEAGKEIKLDEAFDKIKMIQQDTIEEGQSYKIFKHEIDVNKDKILKISI